MKLYISAVLVFLSVTVFSQNNNKSIAETTDQRISTIDFVEVLNNNTEEVLYYYNNNWKQLRKLALEKGYINSYELLKTPLTDDSKIEIILITTYANKEQYDKREEHFQELIKSRGKLRLLNSKKPNEFRKVLFSKEQIQHIE